MSENGATLPFPVAPIKRVAAPPRDVFLREYLRPRRPVILTGLTVDWLPPSGWTLERLATRYGACRVVAAPLAGGTVHEDPRRGVAFHHILLGEFIASLARPGAASDYVSAPTWNLPASFQEDYRVPRYCAGAPHLRAKLWVSKAGTVTPLHRDVPHNLHVHLHGRKRWLLFAPQQSAQLHSRGLLSGTPNFSAVDPEHPDYDRHPRFRHATALADILTPGETLFIPHGWWHHTRSLDSAVSMNFWWGGSVVYAVGLASALFKRLRGISRDEWG